MVLALKRRTRLLAASATPRLPCASNVREETKILLPLKNWSVLAVAPPILARLLLKLVWPRTRSGNWVEWVKGVGKRRMRLFPVSTTKRLPLESTARPVGKVVPVARPPWAVGAEGP